MNIEDLKTLKPGDMVSPKGNTDKFKVTAVGEQAFIYLYDGREEISYNLNHWVKIPDCPRELFVNIYEEGFSVHRNHKGAVMWASDWAKYKAVRYVLAEDQS